MPSPLLRSALSAILALPASAQTEAPEVDPFTGGDPALMAAAGIEAYAPMPWAGNHSTMDIEVELGKNRGIRWAETRHFKIGIGLPTKPLPLPADKQERRDLAAEIKELQKILPKVRLPRRGGLDSWLLVHLYAQRLEALYADFCERTGYEDRAPAGTGHGHDGRGFEDRGGYGTGPFLGQHGKFCLLLVQERSDLARYLRRFGGREADQGTCHHFLESNTLLFVTTPDMRTKALSTERAVHCNVVYGMVSNFVTGFSGYGYEVPVWNVEGVAHWYRRRVDPDYNSITGLPENQWSLLHDADWEAKARGRVNTGAFAPASELLRWQLSDLNDFHKHVMMWSRADFLMSLGSEKYGRYLRLLKELPTASQRDAVLAQQDKALREAYGFDEAGFDSAWTGWVTANYER